MKIAVVGSGVSGLAATWLLNEYSDHEVHLFEADSRPGGHANTVRFTPPEGNMKNGVDVDTGFIVCNPSTYPNFLRFLKSFPSIRILPTDMTFSVSRDRGIFEWAGSDLTTVFCQPLRLFDPDMWRLLYDVMRFNACARRLLVPSERLEKEREYSIGEYLTEEGYSESFRNNYLIPMTAAIWSTPGDLCAMDFPAQTLIQFMHNHHLLQLLGKPSWLTISGGSRVYVDKILTSLPNGCLHLSTPVIALAVEQTDGRPTVRLNTTDGSNFTFDHVIMACHSDSTISILKAGGTMTNDEQRILGQFRWNKNEVVLHSDIELMPRNRKAWTSWNYLTSSLKEDNSEASTPAGDQVSLTYCMNILQHIPEEKYGPVLVTLNPPFEPAAEKIVRRFKYDHPVLDAQAVRAQKEMDLIQGKRGLSFAGAWLAYGFHEDGFTSGLRAVVDHIDGVRLPFDIRYPDRAADIPWVNLFFDVFESTGARKLLGYFLSFWLFVLRNILGVFFDFGCIDGEHRSKTD